MPPLPTSPKLLPPHPLAGSPTDEDEAPADKAQELERGPSELRAAGSLGPAQPSHAPATTQPSSNLSDVLAAKRAALASGAPIPKGPPAPARLAGEAPVVGVVPIAGRVVHAVGAAPAQQERPAVTAEPAGQAGEAAAPRGAAAGAGAHSKALTHGMVRALLVSCEPPAAALQWLAGEPSSHVLLHSQ